MLLLGCLGWLAATAALAAAARSPPAPAGWSHFPGHCMADTGCDRGHCSCGTHPHQLNPSDCHEGSCKCKTETGCFETALARCKKTPNCKSFALMGGEYEMFTLTNWSAVPNSDWDSYAMDSNVKPPTPPPHHGPSPSPPKPTLPNLHEVECAVHAYAYEFGVAAVPSATAALHDALNLQVRHALAPHPLALSHSHTTQAKPWGRMLASFAFPSGSAPC